MRKLLLLLVPVCGALFSFAQKSSSPEAYAKIISSEDLRKNLFILAGPEMEGRETATPGQRKAAAFIKDNFKKLGLLPGNKGDYELFYNVYQDSVSGAGLEVNGKAFELDQDFAPAAGNISATQRFSEVVYVGSEAMDSLKNISVAGKLVMIIPKMPFNNRGRGGILGMLSEKGAAAILIVNSNFTKNTGRRVSATVNLFKKSINPQQFYINEAVASTIAGNAFADLKDNTSGTKILQADIALETKKTTSTLQSSDVIGLLPGTDLKDEYLVVSAHYDHLGMHNGAIYYGADDDGSGTVSIMQIAKAFVAAKAAGKGPRRSIVFLANSGEEEGLWGSEYYTNHPTFPLDKTTADLNIDMIGRSDPNHKQGDSTNYVYVVGDDKLSSDLKPISEEQNKKYSKLELDYKYNDPNDKERIYYRSDHYNFAKNGVPIIFYFDGVHADYHRPTDTPDKINYDLMTKRARLVFYTAWVMANKPEMLKRDVPLDPKVYNR